MIMWVVERKEATGWKCYHGMYDGRQEARDERDWLKDVFEGDGYKFRIRKYVREEE